MERQTYLCLSLFVCYFANTCSHVIFVRVPDPKNAVEKENNNYEGESDIIIEGNSSDILIENWYNWYNVVPSNENSICNTTDKEYKFVESTQTCYKVHTERATWADAEEECYREGGHLAIIDGPDEALILAGLFPSGFHVVHIGLNWSKILQTWVTINETGQILPKARYLNWAIGEPNNISGNQTCGSMYPDGTFDDISCSDKTAFICEKRAYSIPNHLDTTTEAQTEVETTETVNTKPSIEESWQLWSEPASVDDEIKYGTYTLKEETSTTDSPTEPISIETHDVCNTTDTGYIYSTSTKQCYRVYIWRKTWDDAEARCVSDGGHLAVINSQTEADFLGEHFPREFYQVFVGFQLQRKLDSWVTVNGQTLPETGYVKWNEGEPNNIYGDQDCGSMYPDGTFDDIECNTKLGFICEWDPSSKSVLDTTTEVQNRSDMMDRDDIPPQQDTSDDEESSGMEDILEPAFVKADNECGTADTEYTFYESTQSCYKVHADRSTWNDAEMTCVREGGHLAVINSQDEAEILSSLYPEGAMHVFVGFSYREHGSAKITDMYEIREDGVWLTIDDQTLSEAGYENWTPGEPNNAGGREYCGTIYGNGKFDDSACYNEFHYICEIKPNIL